jgi:cell division protein FtsL
VSAEITQNKRRSKSEKRRSLLWLTETQAALSWGAILILAALVGAIYLIQASRIASVGREVQELQWELDEVKRVNNEFERDIAEAQSLDRLEEEVKRMGFIRAQPDDVVYLVVPDFPTEVTTVDKIETVPRLEPVESIGEALWLSFESSINELFRGESP